MPFSFDGEVNSGENVQLTCNVQKGDKPMALSWSFRGRNLDPGSGVITTMIGDSISVLVIPSVSERHSGDYTCTARNAAGVSNWSAVLSVNGRGGVQLVLEVLGTFPPEIRSRATKSPYVCLSREKFPRRYPHSLSGKRPRTPVTWSSFSAQ